MFNIGDKVKIVNYETEFPDDQDSSLIGAEAIVITPNCYDGLIIVKFVEKWAADQCFDFGGLFYENELELV